jgi:ubiquinone/menaquinone biosynthesis C-methylase UbiE
MARGLPPPQPPYPVPHWLRRLLRLGFRLLYNELAFTYDWVSWAVSAGQWRSWQRAALPFLRGARVLEVAHGPGHMLLALAREGRRPVGLDLSAAMGRQARGRLRRAGLAVPLLRGRVEALPLASAAVDSILSTFPTEFLVSPTAVAEFYRVLAPGGVLVAVPSARFAGLGPTDRLAGWLFRVTGQSASDWYAPFLGVYAAAGFLARVEFVRLPRSTVTVLVSEKPSGDRGELRTPS